MVPLEKTNLAPTNINNPFLFVSDPQDKRTDLTLPRTPHLQAKLAERTSELDATKVLQRLAFLDESSLLNPEPDPTPSVSHRTVR